MKSLFTLLIITITITNIYTQDSFKLGFTGAYPNYYNYPVMSAFNWNNYKDLNMNLWQGWWIGSDIDNSSKKVLDSLSHYNIDGYFEPDSIRWAGYGRVQINEAEENTSSSFRYNNHQCGSDFYDNTSFGSNQWVRYFNKNDLCNNQSPSGIVLSGVNENGFQSFTGLPYDPKYQVPFPYNCYSGFNRDTAYINTYYIKPRMRIDSAVAFSDPPKNICKVIVKAYNGDTIRTVIITTEDFKYSDYNGRYIEDYRLHSALLAVSADDLNRNRPSHDASYLSSCHVDYEIYWYGTVSFWIDYVKVMDEAAYKLFNTDPNIGGALRRVLKRKVVNLLNNDPNGKMKGFYMEEVDYSNLACLKLLNDSLPSANWTNNQNYKMICLINPWSYQRHLHEKGYKLASNKLK